MKIHTNDALEVARAIRNATRDLPGVLAEVMLTGSRSHDGAVVLRLEGTSNRRTNAGTSRGVDRFDLPNAATWDEWGVMFARVFEVDPHAVVGSVKHPTYDGAEHYHYMTGKRFIKGILPDDTHQNHRWEWDASVGALKCKGCTATRPRY